MAEFIAFDTETTGVNAALDSIIEIGAARFKDGQLISKFESLIKPGCPIPPEAVRIHGITEEMVKDAPALLDVLCDFANFCGDTVLVAHNAAFDVKFISSAVESLRSPAPTGLILDSYRIARYCLTADIDSPLKNHRLSSLVEYYKIDSSEFHRALADSIYCGKVFLQLLRELGGSRGSVGLKQLVKLSGGETRLPQVAAPGHQIAMF